MRIDRPVGTLLLLWPTLAALWLAARGVPPLGILAAFVAGTFLTRSAGCVVNDMADRHFDPHVRRTRNRPLAAGEISPPQALVLLAVLSAAALGVALTLNWQAQLFAVAGAAMAVLYPFCKRWTHLPQAALGIVFSWGIPMAFAAVNGAVGAAGWLLFAGSLVWVVGYDTIYAMVDRDDDLRIGIKSLAVLLGRADIFAIGALQCAALALFAAAGAAAGVGAAYYLGVGIAALLFVYQQALMRGRERDACFRAFGNNVWAGFALFAGAVVGFVPGLAAFQ